MVVVGFLSWSDLSDVCDGAESTDVHSRAEGHACEACPRPGVATSLWLGIGVTRH
jgi:hypothetical protein